MGSGKKRMQIPRCDLKFIDRGRKADSGSKMAAINHMWLLQFGLIIMKSNSKFSSSVV